jgi:peptidoglycan hydrolase-like protein with peptidoglycan-binding domain
MAETFQEVEQKFKGLNTDQRKTLAWFALNHQRTIAGFGYTDDVTIDRGFGKDINGEYTVSGAFDLLGYVADQGIDIDSVVRVTTPNSKTFNGLWTQHNERVIDNMARAIVQERPLSAYIPPVTTQPSPITEQELLATSTAAVSTPAPKPAMKKPTPKSAPAPETYRPLPDVRSLTGGLEGLLASAKEPLGLVAPAQELPARISFVIVPEDLRPLPAAVPPQAVEKSVGLYPYLFAIEHATESLPPASPAAVAIEIPKTTTRPDDALINFIARGGLLKRGMNRPEIVEIQGTFAAMGMQPQLDECLDKGCTMSTDGRFDALTETALIDFQSLYELGTDGIVGKQTLAAIQIKQFELTLEKAPELKDDTLPKGKTAQWRYLLNAMRSNDATFNGEKSADAQFIANNLTSEMQDVERSLALFKGNIPRPILKMLADNGMQYLPNEQQIVFIMPLQSPGMEVSSVPNER